MDSLEREYFLLREKYNSDSITRDVFIKALDKLCLCAQDQDLIAWHSFFKSRRASEEENFEELYIIVKDLMDRFENSSSINDLKPLSMAIGNKGLALIRQGKPDEAIAVCNYVVQRFSDKSLLGPVAIAMLNISVALSNQDKLDQAITVCDDVINKFGKDKDPWIRESVNRSLYLKASMLIDQGKHSEALPVCENLIRRLEKDENPKLRKKIEKELGEIYMILLNRGEINIDDVPFNTAFIVAMGDRINSSKKMNEADKPWEEGNYRESIDIIYEAWKIDSENPFIPAILNEYLVNIGQSNDDKLENIFNYTTTLDDCLPKYIIMAHYYIQNEDYSSALPILEKCITEEEFLLRMEGFTSINDETLNAYDPLFMKHSYYSRKQKMKPGFGAGLLIKSMYVQHNAWKGNGYLATKEPHLAIKSFEKIIESFPGDAHLVYPDYALSLFSAGRSDESEFILEKIDLKELENSNICILLLFIGMKKLAKGKILESFEMLSLMENSSKSKTGLDVFVAHGCYHFVEAIIALRNDINYKESLAKIDKSIKWLTLSKDIFLLVAKNMKEIIALNKKFDSLFHCKSLKELSEETHELRSTYDAFVEKVKEEEPKKETFLGLNSPAYYYALPVPYQSKLFSLLFFDYALHFIAETKDMYVEHIIKIIELNQYNSGTNYGELSYKQLEKILTITKRLIKYDKLGEISEDEENEIINILQDRREIDFDDNNYEEIRKIMNNILELSIATRSDVRKSCEQIVHLDKSIRHIDSKLETGLPIVNSIIEEWINIANNSAIIPNDERDCFLNEFKNISKMKSVSKIIASIPIIPGFLKYEKEFKFDFYWKRLSRTLYGLIND